MQLLQSRKSRRAFCKVQTQMYNISMIVLFVSFSLLSTLNTEILFLNILVNILEAAILNTKLFENVYLKIIIKESQNMIISNTNINIWE